MNTLAIVLIIVIALAFVIGTLTALLMSKPLTLTEEQKEARRNAPKKDDDDDDSGFI